ncbi:MAG: proton-conducting transporter membrane subunit [Chloroflexota bacterium]
MENFASLVPLVIFIPLIGMLINLFLGKNIGERAVGIVASTAAALAFSIALVMAFAITRYGFEASVVNVAILPAWITIPSAHLTIPWQLRVDTLSLTMMLVVTGVGTLIHIYAIGYMHGDSRFPRFFVYLNLFLAFMLILVTGNNYLVMFVGWEGVGLCSFLLIGFWFDKPRGEGWKNSNAARKAFIVNRVGDFGFLLAIFLTFWTFGTLDYYKPGEVPAKAETSEVAVAPASTTTEAAPATSETATAPAAASTDTTAQKGVFVQAQEWLDQGGTHVVPLGPFTLPFPTVITLITLCMLIGVTGKSAQIPLFVWLPDAMAGPTPVSALIHAATMVTAGIYLITRSNVLFHAAPLTSAIVTGIGGATAIMAAFIAMGQWDIKKVLAYSTISQLGFMVAAVGLGGYVAGMFHLVTHAFFKALLFLGSGSVIHGVEHGHHLAHAGHGDHGGGHDTEHAADHAEHTADAPSEEVFDAQDMRNMGGLRKRMPITFWTYLIGTLALAGIFPLSGFWSKDEILAKALSGISDGKFSGAYALALLLIAAGFTAFYMWRQICLVFLGEPRSEAAANAPESTSTMTFALIVLAILAFFGGLLNVPEVLKGLGLPLEALTKWLEESVTFAVPGTFSLPLALTALVVAVGALLLAHAIYGANPLTKRGRDPLQARAETRWAFNLANAKLYWDEIYGALLEQPYNRLSQWFANVLDWQFWHDYVHNTLIGGGFNGVAAFLSNPMDKGLIDRGFMDLGKIVEWSALRLRRIQTGYIRTYVFTVLVGVLVVLFVILFPLIRQLLQR